MVKSILFYGIKCYLVKTSYSKKKNIVVKIVTLRLMFKSVRINGIRNNNRDKNRSDLNGGFNEEREVVKR